MVQFATSEGTLALFELALLQYNLRIHAFEPFGTEQSHDGSFISTNFEYAPTFEPTLSDEYIID